MNGLWHGALIFLAAMFALWLGVKLLLEVWWVVVIVIAVVGIAALIIWWLRWRRW